MPTFVQCPRCQGLLKASRETCPHCEYSPPNTRLAALGLAAAAGFLAFSNSCGPIGVAAYGPCLLPDGNYCGASYVQDSGPDGGADAGPDGGPDAGDAG